MVISLNSLTLFLYQYLQLLTLCSYISTYSCYHFVLISVLTAVNTMFLYQYLQLLTLCSYISTYSCYQFVLISVLTAVNTLFLYQYLQLLTLCYYISTYSCKHFVLISVLTAVNTFIPPYVDLLCIRACPHCYYIYIYEGRCILHFFHLSL